MRILVFKISASVLSHLDQNHCGHLPSSLPSLRLFVARHSARFEGNKQEDPDGHVASLPREGGREARDVRERVRIFCVRAHASMGGKRPTALLHGDHWSIVQIHIYDADVHR